MLTNIELKNFKCFKDSGNIEIKPLTLLCGVNSSGKSSIIKSLLTLKQSYESAGDKIGLVLNGKYVVNGNSKEVSHNQNAYNIISINNEFVLSGTQQFERRSSDEIRAFKNISKLYPKYRDIVRIKIKISNEVVCEGNDCLIKTFSYLITVEYKNNIIQTSIIFNRGQKWKIDLSNFPNDGNLINISFTEATCYFEGYRVVNIFSKTLTNDVDNTKLFNSLYTIFRYSGNLYRNIKYLTPLRVYPERMYLNNFDIDDVGLSGEYTTQYLNRFQMKDASKRGFLPNETKAKALKSYVNLWLKYFGMQPYSIPDTASDAFKLNMSQDNVINVGFGVSQVLPIIVKGLNMYQSDTLLLEQPEIHLHPRAQMSMGDFLVGMANAGKGVIAETHSDHIINRVVRRIMDGTIDKRLVSIYFIENMNNRAEIIPVQVDSIRGITNAPMEFFTQFASESSEIFKVGMENLRKRNENE